MPERSKTQTPNPIINPAAGPAINFNRYIVLFFVILYQAVNTMGLVYAEIELINGEHIALARRNIIGEEEVKRMWVNALVDTGSIMLCINENIQEQLQLPIVDKRKAQMTNSEIVECDVVAPVEVRFKNRSTTCRAMVLPGNSEVLLGAIPLEDMDVLIHPQRQELIVHPDHPYFAQMKIK
jgi:clan AA aspartic protease